MSASFSELCEQLQGALQFLPDKPEETPESTVSALWHAAAGAPIDTSANR